MTTATIASPAELLQTPEGFRRWLDAQDATDIVGQPESLFSCPLARYLNASGFDCVAVGPHSVRWEIERAESAPRYLLPDWCADFVHAVDRNPFQAVTAAHARALLHQVAAAA